MLMRREMTGHFQADMQCRDQGARLVRFDSEDEIRAVASLLWRRQPFDFKIGLTDPPPVELPTM